MYREVSLSQPDKDLHRFLWRPTPQDQICDYRMTRVTFGVSASPYLAVRTLQQAAQDHGADYPDASLHILTSFYVDDLLAGANTPEEALKLFADLRTILEKAGFNLCKWRSNSNTVLHAIPTELQETIPVKELTDCHSPSHPKALGLEWDSSLDTMAPAIQPSSAYKTTKRGVVSDVSKTFDILGWISPCVCLDKFQLCPTTALLPPWKQPDNLQESAVLHQLRPLHQLQPAEPHPSGSSLQEPASNLSNHPLRTYSLRYCISQTVAHFTLHTTLIIIIFIPFKPIVLFACSSLYILHLSPHIFVVYNPL